MSDPANNVCPRCRVVKVGDKVCFPQENTVPYFQDHHFPTGMPTNVDFTVTEITTQGSAKLVALGYGVLGKDSGAYGSGAIHVQVSELCRTQLAAAKAQLAREREVKEAALKAIAPMARFGPVDIDTFDDEWKLPVYPGAFSVGELRAARKVLETNKHAPMIKCPDCDGTGAEGGLGTSAMKGMCHSCDGTGEYYDH